MSGCQVAPNVRGCYENLVFIANLFLSDGVLPRSQVRQARRPQGRSASYSNHSGRRRSFDSNRDDDSEQPNVGGPNRLCVWHPAI